MKKILSILAWGATALGTSSVMAVESRGISDNTMAVQEVRDRFPPDAHEVRQAFRAGRGMYDLNDGTTLSLYQNGQAIFAEVSGQAPVEVIATRHGTFVAVNGATEIRFIRDAAGQVARVAVKKTS